MTRFRALFAATLALVVATGLLTSCGTDGAAALTVNGDTYSRSALEDDLGFLVDHPDYVAALYGSDPSTDTQGAVNADFVAGHLSLKAVIMMVEAEFEARGLTLADSDYEAAAAETNPEVATALEDLPESRSDEFRDWNAKVVALRNALAAEAAERPESVSDDEVHAFFEDYGFLFQQEEACVRHILLNTEDEATSVLAELEGGADFADLAEEHTEDPSGRTSGGDLGCTGRGMYVPEFEQAVWQGPVGEVQGPVGTSFGYHLILVESRGARGFESVEPEIRGFLESPVSRDGRQLFNLWYQRTIVNADVEVDPRYGSWDDEFGVVQPPSAGTNSGG